MIDLPVSVVIPTYNRADLIGRAVESVLAAVCDGDEVIVVDDGSTDGTDKALTQYRSKIRYLRIANSGAGAARNHGVRAASHDLVAFNDSDDFWMPDRLTLQRTVMRKRPDVLFCFSDLAAKRENGTEAHRTLSRWHGDPRPWDEILGPGVLYSELGELPAGRPDFKVHFGNLYVLEMENNYIAAQTLLVRRRAAGDALHFAEDVAWAEDWECFGRLTGAGLAAYLDCETAWQSVHSGPRLTTASEFARATIRLKSIERVWGADREFLKREGERYRRVLSAQHMVRARGFIGQGRTAEARQELELAGGGSMAYRALTALPGPLLRGLVSVRRAIRGE